MADFETWDTDNGGASPDHMAGARTRQIRGGMLDPSTFPSPWPPVDGPQIDRSPPQITGPLDTDVHAEVLRDIQKAQAALPPLWAPTSGRTSPSSMMRRGIQVRTCLSETPWRR